MDNRIFNVNGRTKDELDLATKLFMTEEFGGTNKVMGYYLSEHKGLVLVSVLKPHKSKPFTNVFGNPEAITDPLVLSNVLWEWLQTEEAKTVKTEGWDSFSNDVGSCINGWRLYTESWGCISDGPESIDTYSIGAFKPAWLWYGK